jgi:hypothetical protein
VAAVVKIFKYGRCFRSDCDYVLMCKGRAASCATHTLLRLVRWFAIRFSPDGLPRRGLFLRLVREITSWLFVSHAYLRVPVAKQTCSASGGEGQADRESYIVACESGGSLANSSFNCGANG